MRPGGWVPIQVPISGEVTFEDPAITDAADRERLFWQSDHVRLYGLDIKERLQDAGFEVKVIRPLDLVEPKDVERMRMPSSEPLFFCRKPAT